ncbi:ABC transporter permease subunit [Modestobacter sp. I12A-02628]|uniref:Transport permease protein n=1 Tax=Goekera deserti TaxID=2497753 RepID=A0A7K3WIM8_9ACTN|nr:ABC transporter permease [Goekera deserti]MPQ96647.1 ABC transporter permease subunit [Goekera deserti]NDI47041.1 ABC transporter permease [Goekera deserti]NEL56277.1 ABC transporter permease [Goekera deserti]
MTAPVLVADRGLRHELRAAGVVWQRDLIRFRTDRGRIVSSFVQPLLFLFVLGKGLGASIGEATFGGADYSTFLFPGVLASSVMFTAVFSAISIVWDREQGFLREMLVAPISRTSIVLGKCLGGATVATLQALVLLALAGLVGVPYAPLMLVGAIGLLLLIAFAITAFGLLLAVRVQQIQTVMPRVQLLLTPLMFLSGAFFPLSSAVPGWLHALTLANPLSYGVDVLRRLVLAHTGGDGDATALRWGEQVVPIWVDVAMVAGAGVALLALAAWLFSRTD